MDPCLERTHLHYLYNNENDNKIQNTDEKYMIYDKTKTTEEDSIADLNSYLPRMNENH